MGQRFICIVIFCFIATGCAKKKTTDPTNTTNPPVGTVDDTAGFYVRHVTSPNYTYVTHKGTTEFATACVASAGEALDCITEAEETDLFFNGITFQYNLPSTLCTYLSFRPYYYYADRGGIGPANIQYDIDSTGAIGLDPANTGTITAPATGIDCMTSPYKFDHSTEVPPGPNCCEGSYTKIVRTWDATAINYVIGAPITTTWGGLRGSCLDGPAVATQPKNDSGFPLSDLRYVGGVGLNQVYTVAAPISGARASNVYASNYFESADHPATPHVGWPAGAVIGGADDPTMFYEWSCLDAASEVKARIRIQVREWNTKAAFDLRESAPTDHSLTGTESSPFGAYQFNDYNDWKDLGNSFPGFKY
jgi:hypothetical protein